MLLDIKETRNDNQILFNLNNIMLFLLFMCVKI